MGRRKEERGEGEGRRGIRGGVYRIRKKKEKTRKVRLGEMK